MTRVTLFRLSLLNIGECGAHPTRIGTEPRTRNSNCRKFSPLDWPVKRHTWNDSGSD